MSAALEREKIWELIAEAQHGEGEAAVRAGEAAVRAADLLNDAPLAYQARMALVRAGTFFGWADRALVAFAWCRGYARAHPDEVDEYDLTFAQKWVVANLSKRADVPRARIEAALADYAEASARWGPRSARSLELQAALVMGDHDRLRPLLAAWLDTRRDAMSDCPACELSLEVEILTTLREDERALRRAAPLFEGRLRCAEVPHVTHSYVLQPLLRLGRTELAAEHHARGYALVRRNRDFLHSVARHVSYLVRIGDHSRAATLFERHLQWTIHNREDMAVCAFWAAAAGLFTALARVRPRPLRLELPAGSTGFREDGVYDPQELARVTTATAAALAERLDARNGNGHYGALLREATAPPATAPAAAVKVAEAAKVAAPRRRERKAAERKAAAGKAKAAPERKTGAPRKAAVRKRQAE